MLGGTRVGCCQVSFLSRMMGVSRADALQVVPGGLESIAFLGEPALSSSVSVRCYGERLCGPVVLF